MKFFTVPLPTSRKICFHLPPTHTVLTSARLQYYISQARWRPLDWKAKMALPAQWKGEEAASATIFPMVRGREGTGSPWVNHRSHGQWPGLQLSSGAPDTMGDYDKKRLLLCPFTSCATTVTHMCLTQRAFEFNLYIYRVLDAAMQDPFSRTKLGGVKSNFLFKVSNRQRWSLN